MISTTAPAASSDGDGAAGCAPRTTQPARVAAVEDGVTLVLADGRRVRLAGLHVPEAGETRARAHLSGWTGRAVRLAPLEARDRYGRMVAHVFSADGREWLQFMVARAGDAIVLPQLSDDPCLAALLRAEAAARSDAAGLWDGVLRIRQAADPRLARSAGSVALVEGRVVSVGKTRSNTFLNFGPDWSLDFTVMIPVSDQRSWGPDALQPDALEGHRIRVRGYLEEWNGGLIRVRTPAQIERLDGYD
ncbi:thermonuclease family protein [Amorphus coralli]|uniref:thermonuclease family protein n=1 Tax=Amorphus coralli TaxID=340680 RepID=UPI0003707F28|nr:thermonuclease family protein [Amorphus coralli]